jgi:hypothetical protein
MTEPLSRYSQTRDISNQETTREDANAPFSFQEWSIRNFGTIADKENIQYERYLRDWYRERDEEVTTAENIKEDYIQLLKQITLIFGTEEEQLQLSDIDFDDETQVKLAIPFYASKIKEIAQYFVFKREAIKKAKLKYNMVNTNQALERLFYEYILKAFTKNKFDNEYTVINDPAILSAVPDLSASQNMFIEIEEIYDDSSYFDRDPSLPLSTYFVNTSADSEFLQTKGLTDDDFEWIYNTGVSQLCADNPLLWVVDSVIAQYENGIPLSAVENNITNVLNDYNRIKLTQKYLGEDQYIISGGFYSMPSGALNFDLAAGNNWFYWPSGDNLFSVSDLVLDPINLTESDLIDSGATAGKTLTSADILFTQVGSDIKGAWLKLTDKATLNETMSARFFPGKTTFTYPFPGFGLSGEDLPWTGKEYSNINRTFFFLEKETQTAIWNLYQSSLSAATTAFNPLYIYDSKLTESGATAGSDFESADVITARQSTSDGSDNGVYTDQQDYAWLYKMDKTDIPVAIGNNDIYWPFERITGQGVTMVSRADQCDDIALSSIDVRDFTGAVAGVSPGNADKIFIKESPDSNTYKEGAWLKGTVLSTPLGVTDSTLLSGNTQPGLAIRVLGGVEGSFVWPDSVTPADSVFKYREHQDDCLYLDNDQFSLSRERTWQDKDINYNQWQDCTCRAVLYTPLGHPGNTFDEYEGLSDYIVAITDTISAFSFSDWRGSDGLDYTQSNDFGWFKLDGGYAVEPDVGWGSGNWVTNTGSPFLLSANVMYLYFRNGLKRDNPEINVPYLITKYKTQSPTGCEWRKLRFNKQESAWVDADATSDMILRPGELLRYEHQSTKSIVLTAERFEITTQERPLIPDLRTFTISSSLGQDTQLPTLSTSFPVNVVSSEQIPFLPADPVDSAFLSSVFINQVTSIPVTFTSAPTGPVTLSAEFGNISNNTLTTVTSTITTTVYDFYTYTSDAVNFMWNTPLAGWNYSSNQQEQGAPGARPFWAKAYDLDNDFTKRKGINIWSGSPVITDEYNFITQPPFSDMLFKENIYIEYLRRGSSANTWVENITGTVSRDTKEWKEIDFDTDGISNLSAVLFNNIQELIIDATDIDSDITFDISDIDEPQLINYYARVPFTWNQVYIDSTNGLPPTGGVWNPILSGSLVDAAEPYANLTNRHFPTYAVAPYIGAMYTAKEFGGFMLPYNLGVSIALTQSDTNILETRGTQQQGIIYQNPNLFNVDNGLTQTTQYTPISTVATDSTWLKAIFIEAERRGLIINPDILQEFVPYQTTFETLRRNSVGVLQQQDSDDQHVYIEKELKGFHLIDFETDIFGHQFGLYNSVSSIE